jgi:hypothetical protein
MASERNWSMLRQASRPFSTHTASMSMPLERGTHHVEGERVVVDDQHAGATRLQQPEAVHRCLDLVASDRLALQIGNRERGTDVCGGGHRDADHWRGMADPLDTDVRQEIEAALFRQAQVKRQGRIFGAACMLQRIQPVDRGIGLEARLGKGSDQSRRIALIVCVTQPS